MVQTFFFDTYALVEISKGNPKYENYKSDIRILLNKLNIMEYSLFLIREGRKEKLSEVFDELSNFNIDYDNEILIKAAEMKNKYKKEKLSFIDCIGYLLAIKNNAKFLTGDEKFKDKNNVEFVK